MNHLLFICIAISVCQPAYAFWGNKNSEEAMKGYRQCMSDKRKIAGEKEIEYIKCKNRKDQFFCGLFPIFNSEMESELCRDEYGIRK